MAAKRHERTYGRGQAIQLLYQAEILDMAPEELLEDESNFVDGVFPSAYARLLVNGVKECLDSIDEIIEDCSDNWALDRMPAVDRAVLRLAAYEMLHVKDVPVAVAINEAVDLAREYGGEDESPRFVNGVLGRIARRIDTDDALTDSGESQNDVIAPASAPEAAYDGESPEGDNDMFDNHASSSDSGEEDDI